MVIKFFWKIKKSPTLVQLEYISLKILESKLARPLKLMHYSWRNFPRIFQGMWWSCKFLRRHYILLESSFKRCIQFHIPRKLEFAVRKQPIYNAWWNNVDHQKMPTFLLFRKCRTRGNSNKIMTKVESSRPIAVFYGDSRLMTHNVPNDNTHDKNVASIGSQKMKFSYGTKEGHSHGRCGRSLPGLSQLDCWHDRQKTPLQDGDHSGNDSRLVPGFLRQCSEMFPEWLRIMSVFVGSEETRLTWTVHLKCGTLSCWIPEIVS